MTENIIHVLLIEDNPGDARLIREMLKDAGENLFTLRHAQRLDEGMQWCSEGTFDVILLDLGLPESKGLDTLEKAKSQESKIPYIILTGLADEEVGVEAVASGAQDYLVKGQIDGPLLGRTIRYAIERHKFQQEIAESERQLRLVTDYAPVSIAHCDKEQKFKFINKVYADMLGVDQQEIIGKHISDLTGRETYERFSPYVDSVLNGNRVDFEIASPYENKNLTYASVSYVPELDMEGSVQGFVAVVNDISERKHAEERIRKLNEELERRVIERTAQLEAANKELEAFSYSVSHDLRAPLRRIDGFSGAVLEDCGDSLSEKAKMYLERARASSQMMGQLIDDMLSLSRITRVEMHRRVVDISGIATIILSELQRTNPERRVKIVIAPGLTANADYNLMKILLDNLLGNAWKFTGKNENAQIEVGADSGRQPTLFFVKDNGAGFDMNYSHKLFNPFQRLHSNEDFEGTGIGLATVQRIINRHGGNISVEAEVGKGAAFYFTLES